MRRADGINKGASEVLKTRLEVIRLLRQQPHTIRDLQDELDASRQAITYHVKNLASRKIAQCRIEERQRADGLMAKIIVYWIAQ